MRRALLGIAVTLGLVFGAVVMMVDAVEVRAAETRQAEASDKVRQVTGTVSVDPGGKGISVESRKKGVVMLALTPETKVRVGKTPGVLADIKTGDKVVCKYREAKDGNICVSVKVVREE